MDGGMIESFFNDKKLLIVFFLVVILVLAIRLMRSSIKKSREKRHKILSRLRREENSTKSYH